MVNQRGEVGSHRGEVSAIGQPCTRQRERSARECRGPGESSDESGPQGRPSEAMSSLTSKAGSHWDRSVLHHLVPPVLLLTGLKSRGSSDVCSQS